jgi:hypothetical protein
MEKYPHTFYDAWNIKFQDVDYVFTTWDDKTALLTKFLYGHKKNGHIFTESFGVISFHHQYWINMSEVPF